MCMLFRSLGTDQIPIAGYCLNTVYQIAVHIQLGCWAFKHQTFKPEPFMQAPADLFQDLANIEMVGMLNEAFCELHHKPYCPVSEELSQECGKVMHAHDLHMLHHAASNLHSHNWEQLDTTHGCILYSVTSTLTSLST